jgi:hypothetical protein
MGHGMTWPNVHTALEELNFWLSLVVNVWVVVSAVVVFMRRPQDTKALTGALGTAAQYVLALVVATAAVIAARWFGLLGPPSGLVDPH